MKPVAHIIDARTPADMIWQMQALREANEPVFSLGLLPKSATCEVTPLRRTLGPAVFSARQLAGALPIGATLHVWSVELLKLALAAARQVGGQVVLSIPHLPDSRRAIEDIPWLIGQHGLTLTVPSRRSRDLLLGLGADPQRLATLPPAADASLFQPPAPARRAEVRQALGIPADVPVMVVPGEMVRCGGHKLASWSHAILRNMHKPVQLLMPGCGPQENTVKFFANTTGFVSEVYFTGDDFSRRDIFAAADGAMWLSTQDRGVTAIVQAMAAALPVLASATPDVCEICEADRTALLIKVGDPRTASAILLQLLDDQAHARRLGQAGLARAREKFEPAKIRKILREIYDQAKPL